MLTSAELLILIRNEIASSVELSDWCFAKYGKRPVIYMGIKGGELPPAEDYPIVVIEDITETMGNAQPIISWGVNIGFGIIDEGIVTAEITRPGATPEDDPILVSTTKTFSGLADVETFREKIEKILKAARFAKITFNTQSGSLIDYPEFNSFTFATIEQINIRRRT